MVTAKGVEQFSTMSYTWDEGRQPVANGELFAHRKAVMAACRLEGEPDLYICTYSMVTIHLIRKGSTRPWLVNGHEHEGTIGHLLQAMSARWEEHNKALPVHIHKVGPHVVNGQRCVGRGSKVRGK